MKLWNLCIDRPVLATVLSLVVMLLGLVSVTRLQNREYPDVDPPLVSVTTVLTGAAPDETSPTRATATPSGSPSSSTAGSAPSCCRHHHPSSALCRCHSSCEHEHPSTSSSV